MSLASGGQILCSLTTSELLRNAQALPAECSLNALGSFRLKGLRGTEQVFGVGGPGLAAVGVSLRAADQEGNVPRTFTRLIGRGALVDEVTDLLRESWMVTLVGTGGVGKTRLSLAVAEAALDKFADGVWFVELAPVVAESDVIQAVATVLGIRPRVGASLVESVCEAITDLDMLVVLDNCEHVTTAARDVATALGRRCRARAGSPSTPPNQYACILMTWTPTTLTTLWHPWLTRASWIATRSTATATGCSRPPASSPRSCSTRRRRPGRFATLTSDGSRTL